MDGLLKKIGGVVAVVAFILLLSSGIFANVGTFLEWLFTLKYSQPETSVAGSIVVRILTIATSYSLVGLFFGAFGCFSSKGMHILYHIISTILGFVLAYIVWQIEQHILIIIVILSIAIVIAIVLWILCYNLDKKEEGQE